MRTAASGAKSPGALEAAALLRLLEVALLLEQPARGADSDDWRPAIRGRRCCDSELARLQDEKHEPMAVVVCAAHCSLVTFKVNSVGGAGLHPAGPQAGTCGLFRCSEVFWGPLSPGVGEPPQQFTDGRTALDAEAAVASAALAASCCAVEETPAPRRTMRGRRVGSCSSSWCCGLS